MHAVEVRNLTRRFGSRVAVDNLSMSIPERRIFGFLGPDGAGKTTTVRMLSALIAPGSGEAIVASYTLGKDDDMTRQDEERSDANKATSI